jgi:predicted CopG family antitoxin
MARQISVSDEAYRLLTEEKGERSFSEVIIANMKKGGAGQEFMKFAGSLKNCGKELTEIEKEITRDRKKNLGREIKL